MQKMVSDERKAELDSKADPLDELEKVFSDLSSGAPVRVLSGFAPAKDPIAELEDMQESEFEMDALRTSIEDLKARLNAANDRANKLDRDIDGMVALTASATLRIQTALAIIHLLRHDPDATSTNADPRVREALVSAVNDLDLAETKADRIPF